MHVSKVGGGWCCLLAALALVACSGGTSDRGSTLEITASQAEQVVVQVDLDKDGDLDVLTLDPSQSPFVIVEALAGDGQGGFLAADPFAGKTLDQAVSDALAAELETSLERGAFLVVDSAGNDVLVDILD